MSLEAEVKAIVDARLRELGVRPVEYRSDGPLPPGIRSREFFAAECRRLRVGTKHGRVWTVAANEWHDARRPKVALSDEATADQLLAANSKLRLVKGQR